MTSERTPLLNKAAQSVNSLVQNPNQVIPSTESKFAVAKALGALQEGKLPSEQQLSNLLSALKSSSLLSTSTGDRTARLSPSGARAVNSFKAVIDSLTKLLDSKNGDDKLQDLIYHASAASVDIDGPSTREVTSVLPSQREARKDAQKAAEAVKNIGYLLATSGEFRKLGSDFVLIGRQILADVAGKVAENAGKVEETVKVTEEEKENGVDFDKGKEKGKKVAKGLASGRIQGELRESAFDSAVDAKNYLGEKLPDVDEARDQLIEKLKKVVTSAQSNEEYSRAIDTILSLIKKYSSRVQKAANVAIDKTDVNDEEDHISDSFHLLKSLLESFAGGESVDPIIDNFKKVVGDVKDDERLGKYFEGVGGFLERCLKEEGYVVSQKAARRAEDLWNEAQDLGEQSASWKEDSSALQSSLESFSDAITNDSETLDLIDKLDAFGDELVAAGKSGVRALRAEGQGLARDMIDVVLPRLVALIKEIPLPRVEYKSEAIDLVVDDIKFASASFIPDKIRIVNHNDLKLTQGYAAFAADYDTSLRLRVEGLRMHANDISFWFSKKEGFPSFEDSGLLDVSFEGRGIGFDVRLENADDNDRETFFTVSKVDVDISDFTYSVSQNTKWLSFWLAKPFITALIKKNLTSSLETQITEYLKTLDLSLYGLQQRAIATAHAKPTNPLNLVKAVFSPSLFSGSSGVKATQKGIVKYGRQGEYVLAIGVDEQLFPNKSGPSDNTAKLRAANQKASAGSSNAVQKAKKAADDAKLKKDEILDEVDGLDIVRKREARKARRQEGWRSDAFDL